MLANLRLRSSKSQLRRGLFIASILGTTLHQVGTSQVVEQVSTTMDAFVSSNIAAPLATGLRLDEAVEIAINNHPALREARAAIDETRGQAYQASLYPNPRIDSGNPQTIGGTNSVYSFGVTQEVIRGGKRQLDVAAANQAVRRAQFEFTQKRFVMITAVRRSFVAVLASQQRIENLNLLLTSALELEKNSDKLLKAGQSTEADLLLFRLERRRAETALASARTDLAGRLSQLSAQLGSPDLVVDKVQGELSMQVPAYDKIQLDSDVIDKNGSVNAVRSEISRSQELVRRAVAEPIPNVTLQGGTQYTVNTPHEQALVGMYMDIPIWNRNQGAIRAAESTVRRNFAILESTRIDLAKQLADAVARFRSATQQVKSFEDGILPDSQRTLTLVRAGYDRGQFDIVRLVQAQRSVFEVNLEYLSALELRLDSAAEIAGLLQSETFP
jgi:outer membrane protein, heavy metal efflux system